MRLGMVGLGRMGANIVRCLADHGHQRLGFDHSPAQSRRAANKEAI